MSCLVLIYISLYVSIYIPYTLHIALFAKKICSIIKTIVIELYLE